jgi:hypothetical protein
VCITAISRPNVSDTLLYSPQSLGINLKSTITCKKGGELIAFIMPFQSSSRGLGTQN